ncbi:MAG: triose-phosphate isomerase family protein, partial [Nakamurella sp.]
VARKTQAGFRNGLAPVLCIGEPERAGTEQAIEFCIRQLTDALEPARADGLGGRLIVAYEPIWAIGAPEPAEPKYVRTVCAALRDHLAGDALLPDAKVIYGGSAGPGLLPQIADDVDGMFLGRFAHDPAAVRTILDEIKL